LRHAPGGLGPSIASSLVVPYLRASQLFMSVYISPSLII
jgi:hypothetical protein